MCSKRPYRIFLLVIVGILLVPRAFSEDKKAEADAIVNRAKKVMDIRSTDSKPFQFVAGFHFAKTPDDPGSDGLYTETWRSPDQWRLEIDLPGFRQVEIGKSGKRWLSHDLSLEPTHFRQIRTLFQFGDFEVEKISKVWDANLGNEHVECIRSRNKALQYTSCFDSTSSVLVQTKTEGLGLQRDCEYANYQKFFEKEYPTNIRCTDKGSLSLEATITAFRNDASPADSKLFVPANGTVEEPICAEPEAVRPLHTPDPEYPVNSPPPQGDSVFEGIVGIDGELTGLTLKRSAGEAFDQAAFKAMSLWKFQPATCAGVPIATRVTFQIAFHRG